jgi:hypothetical protein
MPLDRRPARIRWMWAGVRCVPVPGAVSQAASRCGELSGRWNVSGLAGRGEGLRRSHDETAGVKPGASPVDRTAVNVGTIDIPFPWGDRRVAGRRVSMGRSRRSTPRSGEPAAWGRATAKGAASDCQVRRCVGEYRRRRLAELRPGVRGGTEDSEQTALLGERRSRSPV